MTYIYHLFQCISNVFLLPVFFWLIYNLYLIKKNNSNLIEMYQILTLRWICCPYLTGKRLPLGTPFGNFLAPAFFCCLYFFVDSYTDRINYVKLYITYRKKKKSKQGLNLNNKSFERSKLQYSQIEGIHGTLQLFFFS